MSKQYPGGLITKTPVTPTSLSAPGIWSLSDQAKAQATNTWPFPRDPQFNYVTSPKPQNPKNMIIYCIIISKYMHNNKNL
jgi:hypothetical protein